MSTANPIFPPKSASTVFPPLPSSIPFLNSPPSLASVVSSSKKVIGFSPITRVDIQYLKDQHSITDDSAAMRTSILEFLDREMKVPQSTIDTIVINRIFLPANQPDFSYLYVEFSDISTAELMYHYARNLRHGLSIFLYVPHSLQPRRRAINNIAYEYRNGTTKHNSKVKYGVSDFVLLIKVKGSPGPWTYVDLDSDSLPPPAFSSTSTSPPPGRVRLPSKRARSPSPSTQTRLIKARKDKEDDKTVTDEDNKLENVTDPNTNLFGNPRKEDSIEAQENDLNKPDQNKAPKTPAKATHLSSSIDIGSFLPSAFLSPKTSSNKNFTFGTSQSTRHLPLN